MLRIGSLFHWLSAPIHFFTCCLALIPPIYLLLFYRAYAPAYPTGDTLSNTYTYIIIPLVEGRFVWQDLFTIFHGHRPMIPNVISVINYTLLNWNIHAEHGLLFMIAVINTAIAIAMFARVNPQQVHWILLPFSAIMLSPQQGGNWLDTIFIQWFACLLITLSVIVILAWSQPGWRTVIAVSILSLLAPYTIASGLLIWGIGLLTMLLFRYHNWRHYAFYLALSIISAFFYLRGGDYALTTPDNVTNSTLSFTNPLDFSAYILAFFGSGIGFESVSVSIITGGISVIMLTINILYLLRVNAFNRVHIWLPLLAYNLGTGALIATGRNMDGLISAVNERFLAVGLTYWLIVIAVSVVAIDTALKNKHHRLWSHVNILLLTVYIGFYGYTLATTTFTVQGNTDASLFAEWDACTPHIIFTRQGCRFYIDTRVADVLAAYDLAGFHHQTYPTLLDSIAPDEKLLIITDSAFLNLHLRQRMLPDINPAQIINVVPQSETEQIDRYATALDKPDIHYLFGDNSQTINGILAEVESLPSFWLITHPQNEFHQSHVDALNEAYPITYQHALNYRIRLTRYVSPERFVQSTDVTFGDDLHLLGWSIPSSLTVQPCASIQLDTLWTLHETDTTIPSGTSFVMADTAGMGITSTDLLTTVPSDQWQPDSLYADTRELTVPCDAEPGSYPLMLGAFDYKTLNELPAAYGDGTPVGGLYYLTNLTVE